MELVSFSPPECSSCHRPMLQIDLKLVCEKCGIWTQESTPKYCNHHGVYGHSDDECFTKQICPHCQGIGHVESQCFQKKYCQRHEKFGHWTKECRSAYCSRCEQLGHSDANCWYLQECQKCGKIGHNIEFCRADNCEYCEWNDEEDAPNHVIERCPIMPEDAEECKWCGAKVDHGALCRDAPCSKCGYEGHNTSLCHWADCHYCQGNMALQEYSSSHIWKTCPYKSKVCFYCGNMKKYIVGFTTHTVRNCPNMKNQQCRLCKEYGHIKKFCILIHTTQ